MFLALEVTFPRVKKTERGRVIESYLRFKNSRKRVFQMRSRANRGNE